MKTNLLLLLCLGCLPSIAAQETQIIPLSGTGFEDAVEWEFFCTAGRNSGHWTQIAVPSCWEQEGFGEYNYGHVPFDQRLKEEGTYRRTFRADRSWKGRRVDLVFEGVMTDAEVKINGVSAGPVHQGGFYEFSHDISGLLKYGRENLVEVHVKKHSDNPSVNEAERKADYWVFGGIYRPVSLHVSPSEHISHVALDARANGEFRADVEIHGWKDAARMEVRLLRDDGSEQDRFVEPVSEPISKRGEPRILRLEHRFTPVRTWSPEFPVLYTLEFRLLDAGDETLHIHREKTGFRTVEVRAQDGIYVNGQRIKFKGVCRHSFHPDHGRTSSPVFSVEVVNLIKDMNMNAVRMSHYPPDRHFLEACDSLGLFVLDELAGWQLPPYDSVIGRKLLSDMIRRDVNHPSVLFWDNGNEGGWNTAYDGEFTRADIQRRQVLHPWGAFGATNTAHYVDYDYLAGGHFAARQIFFPTEMLHGLYDGGLGAGLSDFWLRMWNDPLSAGGFLWVFADEAVRRSDNGLLDSDGNHAPDGILGPYHEKEGSFYAIREIWSPVHLERRYITPAFNGAFRIQNRFHFTGLDQCRFSYEWHRLPGPDAASEGLVLDRGEARADALQPGQWGNLLVPLPEGWQDADVLVVSAWDPFERLIHRWSWPVPGAGEARKRTLASTTIHSGVIGVSEDNGTLTLTHGTLEVVLGKQDGLLREVRRNGAPLPLSNGPQFRPEGQTVESIAHGPSGTSHRVKVRFEGGDVLEWTLDSAGRLHMDLRYRPVTSPLAWTGASFDFPESDDLRVRYLGKGPYRVWKNRMEGGTFGLWEKSYNNTITGHSGFDYPEFKGYYANLYWAEISQSSHPVFRVFSGTDDLFLRLFAPEEAPQPALTSLAHPPGDLSFLLGIPAIGTKFREAGELGPTSRPYTFDVRRVPGGSLAIELTFEFPETDP
ncbi:MAG: glycoside hydrolase family 2 TIM barrel-domain containing protein [Bacteroidales bacterium]